MNLPDEAVQHPVIQEMSILSIDMILLGNVSGHPIGYMTNLTIIPWVGYRFIQPRASAR
jgi:hypothetical protein